MEFQRARTQAQIENRREEILNSCYALFQQEEYDNITLKAISEMTSISRTSMYSYYKAKEEVFLDLLKREYLNWGFELKKSFDAAESITREELCHLITDTYLQRETMMQLLSVHLTAIEKNCSLEKLTQFKKESKQVFDILAEGIAKTFPSAAAEDRILFQQQFLVFSHGLYPSSHPTEKQKEAMEGAGAPMLSCELNEFCYRGLLLLSSQL